MAYLGWNVEALTSERAISFGREYLRTGISSMDDDDDDDEDDEQIDGADE